MNNKKKELLIKQQKNKKQIHLLFQLLCKDAD